MKKFVGEFTSKKDQKGRLVFPAVFKAVAAENAAAMGKTGEPLQFIVKKDLFNPCLTIYTYEEWEKLSEELKSKLGIIDLNRKKTELWRAYMRDRALVSPDETSGRILIPKQLLDKIGVDSEVVFSGNDYRIEIWSKEAYENNETSEEDFIALAEEYV